MDTANQHTVQPGQKRLACMSLVHFDVYRIEADGSLNWCTACENLAEAKEQAILLSATDHTDYFVVNILTGSRTDVLHEPTISSKP